MALRSLWTVRHSAGEPLAVVRIANLQTTVIGPHDAWARKTTTPQPALLSAELHFARPFDAAVTSDSVTAGDTVHYGTLAKLLLACVARSNEHAAAAVANESGSGEGASVDLRVLLEMVWIVLTGRNVNGDDAAPEAKPLLDLARLRYMSLTVRLPKASLLGEGGVSLTAANVFPPHLASLVMYGLALKLHRLRVPTLIGVNANERKAKQFVVVDVELDKFDYYPDLYCQLEDVVVKAMEKSGFETLEALGAYLSKAIMRDFKPNPKELFTGDEGMQIRLSMEKPTAVPFAECPVVEMRFTVPPQMRLANA